MSETKNFLSHVNGMRALAILGIVFYHLNSRYCPAGYFGVDVFLVISGYFLLASLLKAQSASDIHYGSFVLKKSWRILPSWFVVSVIFCISSAWFMIAPDRLDVINTAYRSAFFATDYFIDRLYDYFNQQAHQNLFLHYWYLSITCQMYLLIPLLLMLLLRFCSRRGMAVVLGLIGLLSLAFYVLTTTLQVPESIRFALLEATGMKTTYYHLLPRLWEVLAGGLILLLPAWPEKPRLRALLETLATLGIVLPFFLCETGSSQVYMAALSAILFIRYGGSGPVSRLLAWRPLQWVGTISFSLYLWHWPIMAGWKYVCMGEVHWYDEVGMVLASLLLAALSWRLVEQLKMPRGTTRAAVCARLLPLLLLLGFVGGIYPYYKSIKNSRLDAMRGQGVMKELKDNLDARPHAEGMLQGYPVEAMGKMPVYIGSESTAEPSFILLGDSHATHSFFGMDRYCNEHGLRGLTPNCSLFPLWWCYRESLWNEEKAEGLLSYLRAHPCIKYVFIIMLWENRLCGTPQDNGGPTLDWRGMKSLSLAEQRRLREEGLAEICRRFRELGIRVVLLADVPRLPAKMSPYQFALKQKMLRGIEDHEYLIPAAQHESAAAPYTRVLRRMVDEGLAWALIDSAAPLRQGDAYRTRNDEGQFLYSDDNHLTYAGSNLVGGYIMEEWQRLLREEAASEKEQRDEPAAAAAAVSEQGRG